MARTATLTQIGVLSFGKLMGAIYAGLGFIVGLLYGGIFLIMGGAALSGGEEEGFFALIGGCGAVILVPLFYGILGFLFGLLMACIYNFAAGRMGGLEMTFEDEASVG